MTSEFEYIRIDLKKLLPNEEDSFCIELAKVLKEKEGITTSGRLAMRWHEESFKLRVQELISQIKRQTTSQIDAVKKDIKLKAESLGASSNQSKALLEKISFLTNEQIAMWDKLCKEANQDDVGFFNKYQDKIYDDDDEAVGEILEQDGWRCCEQIGLDVKTEDYSQYGDLIFELEPDFFKSMVACSVRDYWSAINSDNLAQ